MLRRVIAAGAVAMSIISGPAVADEAGTEEAPVKKGWFGRSKG